MLSYQRGTGHQAKTIDWQSPNFTRNSAVMVWLLFPFRHTSSSHLYPLLSVSSQIPWIPVLTVFSSHWVYLVPTKFCHFLQILLWSGSSYPLPPSLCDSTLHICSLSTSTVYPPFWSGLVSQVKMGWNQFKRAWCFSHRNRKSGYTDALGASRESSNVVPSLSLLLCVVLIFSDCRQASSVQQKKETLWSETVAGLHFTSSGLTEKGNVLFKQLHEIPEKE